MASYTTQQHGNCCSVTEQDRQDDGVSGGFSWSQGSDVFHAIIQLEATSRQSEE
jgi:hypothetical protein